MNAVSFYNTTVAAGKMAVAASCIASTGSVGLVPIAASLAVFQGVELFAEAVSKYGADNLAANDAGRDPRKYESYFKTCKHFTDFVASFGMAKIAPQNSQKAKLRSVPSKKFDSRVCVGYEKDVKQNTQRIMRSKIDAINYINVLKKGKEWRFLAKKTNEVSAYINRQTGEIRYADVTHGEIECFIKVGSGKFNYTHKVIDPIDERVLDKPKHELPIWIKKAL